MKKLVLAAALLVPVLANAGSNTHWEYSGKAGPKHWGELNEAFEACSSGLNQSPVNLRGFIESDLNTVSFNYQTGGKDVVNNGHAVQVNYAPGSTIELDNHTFELKQFHFHSPSENQIDGKSYPMEAHLVHADKAGNLAVISVMFEENEANSTIGKVWSQMPENEGGKEMLSAAVAVDGILPANRDYYRFNGSLTTPPCSEGVLWLVMKQSVTASKAQIEKFSRVLEHANNRPIQALNSRSVLQ
ncbi:MAG: carbonic anhydrase family protein [Amphritea sp.]